MRFDSPFSAWKWPFSTWKWSDFRFEYYISRLRFLKLLIVSYNQNFMPKRKKRRKKVIAPIPLLGFISLLIKNFFHVEELQNMSSGSLDLKANHHDYEKWLKIIKYASLLFKLDTCKRYLTLLFKVLSILQLALYITCYTLRRRFHLINNVKRPFFSITTYKSHCHQVVTQRYNVLLILQYMKISVWHHKFFLVFFLFKNTYRTNQSVECLLNKMMKQEKIKRGNRNGFFLLLRDEPPASKAAFNGLYEKCLFQTWLTPRPYIVTILKSRMYLAKIMTLTF